MNKHPVTQTDVERTQEEVAEHSVCRTERHFLISVFFAHFKVCIKKTEWKKQTFGKQQKYHKISFTLG